MNTKKLSVPLIGTGLDDLKPNVAKLAEFLTERGFLPLTKENAQKDLPIGSLALIYNSQNHTMFFALVQKHVFWNNQYMGIGFLPSGKLTTSTTEKEMKHLSDFKGLVFKPIAHLDVVNGIPQVDDLPNLLKGIGFKPLTEAFPEEMLSGSLVFLYEKSGKLIPVIVRELSHLFEGDHRLLFWKQNAIVAGNWDEAVIMGHLTPFNNYAYYVF